MKLVPVLGVTVLCIRGNLLLVQESVSPY